MTPYKAGCCAFALGWLRASNPFQPLTLEWSQWSEGWSDSAYQDYARVDAGPGTHGWTRACKTLEIELARVVEVGHE